MVSSCISYTFHRVHPSPTRHVHCRWRKQVLYLKLSSETVCLSGFQSGKGSITTSQLFSFPFVKSVIGAKLHGKLLGRTSLAAKEKQNKTQLFTFIVVSHSILIVTHVLSLNLQYQVDQLLVFQAISLSSFKNTAVGVNVVLSCHVVNVTKTELHTSWLSSKA